MKPIELYKPVVLKGDLEDMEGEEKGHALDLLEYRTVLVPEKNGWRFISMESISDKLSYYYLYGPEAVCFYRQSLGMKDVSISRIDVNRIVERTEDLRVLRDILELVETVAREDNVFELLDALKRPEENYKMQMWNLRLAVEDLQDNHWCGEPKTERSTGFDVEGSPTEQQRELHSLADIGYKLSEEQEREPIIADSGFFSHIIIKEGR